VAKNPKPSKKWTVRHFSQGNPVGPGQDDVPALLRRVAKTIERMGDVDIMDMTFGTEINEHGRLFRVTVYYDP
jgi:hypothetical protein